MRSFWAALALSVAAIGSYLHAGPPFFLDAPAGRFLVYEDMGAPIVVPVDEIAVVPWTDTDSPDPTPDKLAADVAKWATEIGDTDDSQRYALIFATARDAVYSEMIEPAQIFPVVSRAADSVLKSDWSTFRAKLTEYSTAAKQEGKLGTKTQVINYAATVKHGLELSANGSDAISLDESLAVIAATNQAVDEVAQ